MKSSKKSKKLMKAKVMLGVFGALGTVRGHATLDQVTSSQSGCPVGPCGPSSQGNAPLVDEGGQKAVLQDLCARYRANLLIDLQEQCSKLLSALAKHQDNVGQIRERLFDTFDSGYYFNKIQLMKDSVAEAEALLSSEDIQKVIQDIKIKDNLEENVSIVKGQIQDLLGLHKAAEDRIKSHEESMTCNLLIQSMAEGLDNHRDASHLKGVLARVHSFQLDSEYVPAALLETFKWYTGKLELAVNGKQETFGADISARYEPWRRLANDLKNRLNDLFYSLKNGHVDGFYIAREKEAFSAFLKTGELENRNFDSAGVNRVSDTELSDVRWNLSLLKRDLDDLRY